MEWWHWIIVSPAIVWTLLCFLFCAYFWKLTEFGQEEFFLSLGAFIVFVTLPFWWPPKMIYEYFESRAIRKYIAEIRGENKQKLKEEKK